MQEILSGANATPANPRALRRLQVFGAALALLCTTGTAHAQYAAQETPVQKAAKAVRTPSSSGSGSRHRARDHHRYREQGDGYGQRGYGGENADIGDDLASELVGELGEAFVQVAADAIVTLGAMTMHRLDDSPNNPVHRDNGDILIPFLRYDFYRQSASPGIFALDNRIEAGIGPVAVMVEKYAFYDQRPNSGLTLYRRMFLYRASFTRNFEFDIGGGQTDISSPNMPGGTVGSFSLPLKYKFNDYMTVEFIPTWSGTLNDKELTLEAGKKFISAKVGYRYLTSTTGAILKGPYAGLALRF